jgi:hypothetical protein
MRLGLAILILTFASAAPAHAQSNDVVSWTRSFMDAYTNGDSATVLNSVDEHTTMYGSDVAEIFHGPGGIKTMLLEDAKLWGGKARIGEMKDVTSAKAGDLETIFFNASFTVGDRPPMPVRFCIVRRKSKSHWYLVQSSNSVVTQGQSAEAILKGNPPR